MITMEHKNAAGEWQELYGHGCYTEAEGLNYINMLNAHGQIRIKPSISVALTGAQRTENYAILDKVEKALKRRGFKKSSCGSNGSGVHGDYTPMSAEEFNMPKLLEDLAALGFKPFEEKGYDGVYAIVDRWMMIRVVQVNDMVYTNYVIISHPEETSRAQYLLEAFDTDHEKHFPKPKPKNTDLIEVEMYNCANECTGGIDHSDNYAYALRQVAKSIAEGYGAGSIANEIDHRGTNDGLMGFWSSLPTAKPSPEKYIICIKLDSDELTDYEIATAVRKVSDEYNRTDKSSGTIMIYGNKVGTWTTRG